MLAASLTYVLAVVSKLKTDPIYDLKHVHHVIVNILSAYILIIIHYIFLTLLKIVSSS